MTPLKREKYWPLAASLIPTIIAVAIMWQWGMSPLPKTVPVAIMTFGIVTSGFAATQRNMLLTMGGSRVLRFAATTGYYKEITAYLMQSIYMGLLTTGISGTGIFIENNNPLWIIWTTATTYTVSAILFTIMRNEQLVRRLIERFIEQQGEPEK